MNRLFIDFACLLILSSTVAAHAEPGLPQFMTRRFVSFKSAQNSIPIVGRDHVAKIVVDENDFPGVRRVGEDLQSDLERVTTKRPELIQSPRGQVLMILGTLGKSRLIDDLASRHLLHVDDLKGKWEAFAIQTVSRPFPGVESALVIVGSDQRGAIYGAYELSEQAGVSPWSWWEDVPTPHHDELWVQKGRIFQNSPAVKYRGIFINDEAPDLSNWVHKNFGDYKSEFYKHVFELILRLRGNYLWPAMWNNAFSEDDPKNPALAAQYGIVMGTSHVEPMMRADKEWGRAGYEAGQWNYDKYPNELEKFWKEGVDRGKPFENLITIAMRGKIDTPMSPEANIALLERIVGAQRKIISNEINSDVAKVPQLWCLYKEVQDYYDKGMRVPDDVTLLWADDNWGNIRRLPTADERRRPGGAGVYYHFDYVGGPRNYKWVDTNPLPRIWEQMHLAHESGANQVWIVNVGHLKHVAFPTQFFIRMGWDPDRWNADNLDVYTQNWVQQQFGPDHASEIADLITAYGKYQGRRKPELLDPTTYSLLRYREAERITADFDDLATRSEKVYASLPTSQGSAYFQLVHYQILATANLADMYLAAAQNHLYAAQGRVSANHVAEKVSEYFARDAALAKQWDELEGGRWRHFQDQTHIGYTTWQQPDQNVVPLTQTVTPLAAPQLGVAVEGSPHELEAGQSGETPALSVYERNATFVDLYNKGIGSLSFSVVPEESWLKLGSARGTLDYDRRIEITADWGAVPKGTVLGKLTIHGSDGSSRNVQVPIVTDEGFNRSRVKGFVESLGYVSIEAAHYASRKESAEVHWKLLPNLGRTGSAMTLFPQTAAPVEVGKACLAYPIHFLHGGAATLYTILSPTQLLKPTKGLKFAVSLDSAPPIVVNMHENYLYFTESWEASVAQNSIITHTPLQLTPGDHILKIWGIDSGVVFQKLIVDLGGMKPSYLGPPESYRSGF